MRDVSGLPAFCRVAQSFWRGNLGPSSERIILVEAMSQDLRVSLRNLSIANALRRCEPARVVVFAGTDDDWSRVVWDYYDLDDITMLADAYLADEVFDVQALVDGRLSGSPTETVVAGVDLAGDLPESPANAGVIDRIIDATTCRMAKAPRIDTPELEDERVRVARRSRELARVYDALIAGNDVVALISSHVDYDNFGLAVEAALRRGVPVIFPQSTGGLKAYAIYPENHVPDRPIRASLTENIGEFFEKTVWDQRDAIGDVAGGVLQRLKRGHGRPSWWRGEGTHSAVLLRDAGERAVVRRSAAAKVGLDPDRPIISVFNHAVSDALGTNVEAFDDLGAWFEHTVAFAAEHDEVDWLFLDHPQQEQYDASGFFERLADGYAAHSHLAFRPSLEISKTFLVAMSDLVVTVRGSVSNEYPAFGIPALQAGWSEWSQCGFTTVAETETEYLSELTRHIAGLRSGTALITPEQVQRARLWAWFYRSVADVPSVLVGHWNTGEAASLFASLGPNLSNFEADGDPLFTAVRRMWRRREPFLTRMDWVAPPEEIAERLAGIHR